MLGSRSRGAKIKLPPGAGVEISNAAPALDLSIYQRLLKNCIKKIMVAEKDFLNCYNFNSFRVKHASIHVKSTGTHTRVKKVNV